MPDKFIPYEKMSKKAKKLHDSMNRGANGFNTGTRVHAVKTKYDRKAVSKETRKIMEALRR